MAYGDPTNPLDELHALAAHFALATTGAISRPVTVKPLMYSGYYAGTYPLILFEGFDWKLYRPESGGGLTGRKGQNPSDPSQYLFSLQDVVDPRGTSTTPVEDSITDLLTLLSAISAYFSHLPHRTLPINQQPTVTLAGEQIRVRYRGPFTSEDGGEVRVVLAGSISVVGLVQPGQLT